MAGLSNLVRKTIQEGFIPKIMILPFCLNILRITSKSLQFTANLTLLFSLLALKYTNENLSVFKSFQYNQCFYISHIQSLNYYSNIVRSNLLYTSLLLIDCGTIPTKQRGKTHNTLNYPGWVTIRFDTKTTKLPKSKCYTKTFFYWNGHKNLF